MSPEEARAVLAEERARNYAEAEAEFKSLITAIQEKYGVQIKPGVAKVELAPGVWADKAEWIIV